MPKPDRLWSIDAFRGFTMICMLGEGFGLANAKQFQHVSWNITLPQDLHFWDLIQPFFMFIVGVVMPISFARRWAAGESWCRSLLHVLRRSAHPDFARTVRPFGTSKPACPRPDQRARPSLRHLPDCVPAAPQTLDRASRRSLRAVGHALGALPFGSAPGILGPYVKNANIGWYLDQAILHKNWGGSYATINCLSSAANTIFGMMAGQLLMGALPLARKLRILALTGVAGVAVGLALSPAIPLNKKIWTASFALYSTGATLIVLLLFYWIFDVRNKRSWATLFVIVGSNSIFIYVFHETLHRYLNYVAVRIVQLPSPAAVLLILALEIAVCWALYRNRVFLRV